MGTIYDHSWGEDFLVARDRLLRRGYMGSGDVPFYVRAGSLYSDDVMNGVGIGVIIIIACLVIVGALGGSSLEVAAIAVIIGGIITAIAGLLALLFTPSKKLRYRDGKKICHAIYVRPIRFTIYGMLYIPIGIVIIMIVGAALALFLGFVVSYTLAFLS